MNPTVIMTLDPVDFETLDNALRAHRGSALLVPGAPSPMDAFQVDMADTAKRLGFVPPESGSFWVNIQSGGRNMLCWKAHYESGPALN